MTECRRLSEKLGVRVLLKREDLAHTGSHKLNNVVGQALLTKRMGKTRIIAETGAGQHGVASATAAALFGLECTVFMGEVDTKRQELNVFRMELLGAEVRPVTSGSRTLKDAVNEAMREWVATVEHTHYCLGSVMGPHPFPYMVRELQRVVGDEALVQSREILEGTEPDVVVACVGGGSNAAGTFAGFVDTGARLVGVEAAGGAAITNGIPGVLHGMHSRLLQDEAGSDRRGGIDLGRARLPGPRARARPPGRHRAGRVQHGQRRRGAGRLSPAEPDRGHHSRARVGPRAGLGGTGGGHRRPAQGVDRPDHPVRAGRQGRGPGPGDLPSCPCLKRRCEPSGRRGASS